MEKHCLKFWKMLLGQGLFKGRNFNQNFLECNKRNSSEISELLLQKIFLNFKFNNIRCQPPKVLYFLEWEIEKKKMHKQIYCNKPVYKGINLMSISITNKLVVTPIEGVLLIIIRGHKWRERKHPLYSFSDADKECWEVKRGEWERE